MRQLPFCYYNLLHEGALSPIQWAGYRSNEADFQIAYLGVEADWSDYDTLIDHRPSDLYLMERKEHRERKKLYSMQEPEREENTKEHQQWFGADIDSLRGKDLLWDINILRFNC